nr:alpha/beta hydrolase [Pseudomonas sp.]
DPLERKIGTDKIAIMENCGHFPMMEEPEEFIAHVNRFIGSLKS